MSGKNFFAHSLRTVFHALQHCWQEECEKVIYKSKKLERGAWDEFGPIDAIVKSQVTYQWMFADAKLTADYSSRAVINYKPNISCGVPS